MKLGFVSITLNALPALMTLARQREGLEMLNYLDEGLEYLEAVKGEVDRALYDRMLKILKKGEADGNDGLLITCSMFTPYLDQLQDELSVPVVAADQAMMELAAKKGGKILLLITNPGTVEASTKLLEDSIAAAKTGATLDTLLIEEAWDAVHAGQQDVHDRLIRETIEDNANKYDRIVLAQMSMAAAVLDYKSDVEVLTSPGAALETLVNLLNN